MKSNTISGEFVESNLHINIFSIAYFHELCSADTVKKKEEIWTADVFKLCNI